MKAIKICSSVLLGIGFLLALSGFALRNDQFPAFSVPALIIGAFGLIFSKTVQRHCTLKTTAVSLGLSFTGAAGLTSLFIWYTIAVFHEASKHPYLYPAIKVGMLISFVIFVALIVLYIILRNDTFSVKGLLIDIGTAFLFFPYFFLLCGVIYTVLEELT